MSWDDDFDSEYGSWDDYEYINKLGIYAEDKEEKDPNDELYIYGLDPDELEDMDEERRNRKIEEAGLDPDDYTFYGPSHRSSGYQSSKSKTAYRGTGYSYSGTREGVEQFSISEYFLAAFGAGAIGGGAIFLGRCLFNYLDRVGFWVMVGGGVFSIIAIVYLIKGLLLIWKKRRKK